MLEKRRLLTLLVAILFALLLTYLLLISNSSFFDFESATLYLSLRNEADKPLNVSLFLYLNGEFIDFSNAECSCGNFSAKKIADGSGIELSSRNLYPGDYIVLWVDNIEPTPLLPQNLTGIQLELSFNYVNESDFGYSSTFSVLNKCGMSVASRHYFTIRKSQSYTYVTYYDRVNLQSYLISLIITTTALSVACFTLAVRPETRWFPFLSIFLVWITLCLYIFVGSGFEIYAKSHAQWLLPVSVFFHGYNWHISGNLVYFTILSVLFETFVKIRAKGFKEDIALWYLLPLICPFICSIIRYVWGFGLSYSIEVLTWTLWAYIICNYREVVKNRISVLMAIVAGIPSTVFLSWLIRYLLGYASDPWDNALAVGHIEFGIVSGIVVLLVVFRQKIARAIRKAFNPRSALS